jgi:hypothetical protein
MQRKLAHILISHDVIRACSTIAQKMAQKSNMPWLLDRIEAALFEINPIKSDLIHDCAGSPLPQIDGAREKPC